MDSRERMLYELEILSSGQDRAREIAALLKEQIALSSQLGNANTTVAHSTRELAGEAGLLGEAHEMGERKLARYATSMLMLTGTTEGLGVKMEALHSSLFLVGNALLEGLNPISLSIIALGGLAAAWGAVRQKSESAEKASRDAITAGMDLAKQRSEIGPQGGSEEASLQNTRVEAQKKYDEDVAKLHEVERRLQALRGAQGLTPGVNPFAAAESAGRVSGGTMATAKQLAEDQITLTKTTRAEAAELEALGVTLRGGTGVMKDYTVEVHGHANELKTATERAREYRIEMQAIADSMDPRTGFTSVDKDGHRTVNPAFNQMRIATAFEQFHQADADWIEKIQREWGIGDTAKSLSSISFDATRGSGRGSTVPWRTDPSVLDSEKLVQDRILELNQQTLAGISDAHQRAAIQQHNVDKAYTELHHGELVHRLKDASQIEALTVQQYGWKATAIYTIDRALNAGIEAGFEKLMAHRSKQEKDLLSNKKLALMEGEAAALDAIKGEAEARAKFYAAVGVADLLELNPARGAAELAGAAALFALAGVAGGMAGNIRTREQQMESDAQQLANSQTSPRGLGLNPGKSVSGSVTGVIGPAQPTYNYVTVTQVMQGGIYFLDQGAADALTDKMLPAIARAFADRRITIPAYAVAA